MVQRTMTSEKTSEKSRGAKEVLLLMMMVLLLMLLKVPSADWVRSGKVLLLRLPLLWLWIAIS